MHSSIQRSPGYSSRVLSLQEEGLGLSILEAEHFAVTADIELALEVNCQPYVLPFSMARPIAIAGLGNGVFVRRNDSPCQGRS